MVSTSLNWCKASGSSNNQSTSVTNQALNEDDPSNYCDNQTYQEQSAGAELSAISACAEPPGYTTTDAGINNAGKGGMNKAGSGTSPKIAWRLPTMYDYMVANTDGLRFVLPDMGSAGLGPEWTATIYSANYSQAWTFDSMTGARVQSVRNYSLPVRCVGR